MCSFLVSNPSGARTGMPSVRPNAMNDRRRRLAALNKHESLLQAAARQSVRTQSSVPLHRHVFNGPGMSVYVLDFSQALESGSVTWLPVQGTDLPGAPEETIFYSLVEGRGELVMFGGIRGDARNLQRGNTPNQQKAVSNDVLFLSFVGSKIH